MFYRCQICNKKCVNKLIHDIHNEQHSLKQPVQCLFCKRKYGSYYKMYLKDFCGENDLNENIKNIVSRAVIMLEGSKLNSNITIGQNFPDLFSSNRKHEKIIEIPNFASKKSKQQVFVMKRNKFKMKKVKVIMSKTEKNLANEKLYQYEEEPVKNEVHKRKPLTVKIKINEFGNFKVRYNF